MRPARLKIGIVTPAPPRSCKGNRVMALRWARLLRELGHRVTVLQTFTSQRFDFLVALHARRSAPSIRRFQGAYPDRPIVLALTGTDLYGDIHTNKHRRRSLQFADRLLVLQSLGIDTLPTHYRRKARVIYQSVRLPRSLFGARRPNFSRDTAKRFDVCVLGHLRSVKDPFRTALAARRLPDSSRIMVHHFGAALSQAVFHRAEREMRENSRYRWHGEVPRHVALRRLSRSRLLLLTSKLEGGANAVSEAIALGVPVLSSRIDGSVGLLGRDYAGYFPVGSTSTLTRLLHRAETDPAFYALLRRHCRRLRHLVAPSRERRHWARLLRELRVPRPGI